MSNVAEMSSNRLPQDLIQKHGSALDAWFDERFAKKLKEVEENKTPSLAIIATKGTMDWAYPPF
ncbi:MAG: NADH-quinone oxidoreductase subunit F, partial [Pseudomonadota bacterium]